MKSSLKKIQVALKDYFTYPKSSSIIVVSIDKSELPFAYIVEEDDSLLISYAIDCTPSLAASIALEVDAIKEVVIAENFYISNAGSTYWGDKAIEMFYIDNTVDLESAVAVSEEVM